MPEQNQNQTDNSFWVLYKSHTKPTFLENERTQSRQRNTALRYIKQWRNCIDIGSNVGMWTRDLAQKFEQVYCFEPNPNFIECFNRNITESNVELFKYGLSNTEHTASQEKQSTVLTNEQGSVECKTLDSFNLKNIDFIKIDVDGFEYKVLQGAVTTIKSSCPVINIEMKIDKRKSIIINSRKLLSDLGYNRANRVKSDEIWLKT